jgi:PAS domain S-box-containing protein
MGCMCANDPGGLADMNIQGIKRFRFLLSFFLPVAGVALVAGALNLTSFANLRQEYLRANAQQEQDSRHIAAISDFDQQMAQMQMDVGTMLEKATSNQVGQAQLNRFHSDVVNRLSALQTALDGIYEDTAYQPVLEEARRDFRNYKNSIIVATDLAAVDPANAMRHAFAASQAHVKVDEHSQAIANTIAAAIAARSAENAQAFERAALRSGVTGAVLMAFVLLLWLYLSQRLSRHLSQVSQALSALAQNDIHPASLPLVTRLSEQKSSLLRDMAVSVLSFRDSVLARDRAQYDLGERIKEITCLYDVMNLTEDPDGDLDAMLGAVAQRLPAAMRYPDRAAGWIAYAGRHYGNNAMGESLSVRFGGTVQQPDQLGVTYLSALPVDAGEPFLDEERSLLDALGKRLTNVMNRRRMGDELDRHRMHLEELVALRTTELDAALQEQGALFEAASVGIVLLREENIVRCNRTMDEMFGYAVGAQIGQSVRIWYPDEASFAQAGEEAYDRINLGQVHTAERELVRRDASRFWARLSARAIDVTGLSRDMVCIVEDITQERAAIAEIRRAHALAEAANRSKSEFLANMSHEIRTTMNAIIGMSHLALESGLDNKQRNYIEKVVRASENLLGIINDILDFSKIEAGKMSMEVTDFYLEDVMDNLANLVGVKTEAKGLELHFSTDPAVPAALVGDPLRLGQILINLANNAAKFTERGEIVVGIDKVCDHDDGVELHFWVRDTGIGMTPEQCSKMFQSFSQADASTTRKYGGTGLGLAICKSLVERMRGRIWFESAEGQGSTFHFHARFGVQANPQAGRMAGADERSGVRALVVDDHAGALETLKGARVLLVEDNDLNQELAMELMTGVGMTVLLAQHGREALDILARDPHFDGVLMDCQMPVMDGYEATREIRKNPAFKKLPIIAMTANAMAGDKEKVMEAGMWDHIAKPLNVGAMFATMARWIHPAAVSREPQVATKSVAINTMDSGPNGHFDGIHLPGIDTRSGLATSMNKNALYRRLLLRFRDGQGDFAHLFATARGEPDTTAAERCAHTLRGTAATIGARQVQECAERLELACREQADAAQIDDLLRQVLQALEPVVEGLRALGNDDTTAANAFSRRSGSRKACKPAHAPDRSAEPG